MTETTIDADLVMRPESYAMLGAIPALKPASFRRAVEEIVRDR